MAEEKVDKEPEQDAQRPGASDDERTPADVKDLRERMKELEGHIHRLNEENKDKRLEAQRVKQERDELQRRLDETQLDKAAKKERSDAVAAAKDRKLKEAEAKETLDRLTREAIRSVPEDVEVDEAKVSALVSEFVRPTINADTQVRLSVQEDGELNCFMASDAVERLKAAVSRVIEIASAKRGARSTPPPPGATPPRDRGQSFKPLVASWAVSEQTTEAAKARAEIQAAASEAGRDGHLAKMDTAL